MSNKIDVARINATGALIPVHDGNRDMLSRRSDIAMTVAEKDPETGRLIEINGADHTAMLVASNDLQRIGQALVNNQTQRQSLLVAAMKLPNAKQFLTQLGVYTDADNEQTIDDELIQVNTVDVSDQPAGDAGKSEIEDVSEQLAAQKAKTQGKKRRSSGNNKGASKPDKPTPNLSDL